MNQDVLRSNIVSIVLIGLMLSLTGLALYLFRDQLQDRVRFFMPLPPIGVAAYIFVFNMYRHYDGNIPGGFSLAIREILIAAAVMSIVFGIFTTVLVFVIRLVNRG